MSKPKGYWNFSRCLNAARNSGAIRLAEWRKVDPAGYDAASSRKITKKIAQELGWEYHQHRDAKTWTYEELLEVVKASGAKNWTGLRQTNKSAHYAAEKLGWKESLCKDMGWAIRTNRPKGYWTFERLLEDAKPYKSRKDWGQAKTGGHGAACHLKLASKISKELGWSTAKPRGYWTVDTCVKHLKESGLSSFTEWQKGKKCGYGSLSAKDKESVCAIMGWEIKKQHPAGYWTYERCLKAAKDSGANSINEWKDTGCKGFMTAATPSKKWTRQIAEELGWDSMSPHGYWTYERCLEASRKSGATNIAEFARRDPRAATGAYRGEWTRQIAEELGWDSVKPPGYWTYERCLKSAKDSNARTITEWQNLHGASYSGALKIDAVWDIAEELGFVFTQRPNGFWNYENCVKDAKESGASSMVQWMEMSGGGGYAFLARDELLEEFRQELGWERLKVPKGYWTYERCLESAMNSGAVGIASWHSLANGAAQAARINGWIKDIALVLGWSFGVHDDSVPDTVIYWYTDGEYMYIGETSNPDNRYNDHFLGRNGSIVFDYIDDDIEPEYVMSSDGTEYRKTSGYAARRAERRMIKCAAAKGYKVLNKVHNPQWDGTKFSWEEPLEEAA